MSLVSIHFSTLGVKSPGYWGHFVMAEQAAGKDSKPFLQGRFAPWAEAQGLPSPRIAGH